MRRWHWSLRTAPSRLILQAQIHTQRGEVPWAMALIDRAWAERSLGITAIRADPLLAPLRREKRFADLVARVGFP